jgi:hypothetical protein
LDPRNLLINRVQSETLLAVDHYNLQNHNNLIIKMLSYSTILTGFFALAPIVAAAPAQIDVRSAMAASSTTPTAMPMSTGVATAAAAPGGGLTDVDILNL